MNVITSVLNVFTEVTTWLLSALQSALGLFWDTTDGLTFFGMLAIVPLAISVVMMLFAIIRSYLKFKD